MRLLLSYLPDRSLYIVVCKGMYVYGHLSSSQNIEVSSLPDMWCQLSINSSWQNFGRQNSHRQSNGLSFLSLFLVPKMKPVGSRLVMQQDFLMLYCKYPGVNFTLSCAAKARGLTKNYCCMLPVGHAASWACCMFGSYPSLTACRKCLAAY